MATNPIINIPPAPSLDLSIGTDIGSSTPASVLFVDAASKLAQGSLSWAEATRALTIAGDISNHPMLRLVRNEAATISYNTDDGFTYFTTADNNYGLGAPVGYLFAAQGNPEGHLQMINGTRTWSLAFRHSSPTLTIRDVENSIDYLQFAGGGSVSLGATAGANLLWGTDGAGDIGAAGMNRPANIYASGNLRLAGSLGVGNAVAATTPGTVVKAIEVFDASGVSLGFIPVYDAIT